MATTVQKITLSPSRDIPFNKLLLSQSNVRRIKAGVSIEELAEDIARRGLLQGLSVRPVVDGAGVETGMFEIPAGGRRYRALELLVKQKRLARTAPVPCVIREGGIAEEDSLAENVQRAPLHPLDQFRAFLALREKGQSEEDIAAAFFVSVGVVKQRLKLASVSPVLLEVYAEEGMTLDQLMAFTVSGDHAHQEHVFERLKTSFDKQPYAIRRMLTEGAVRACDKRAQFIGLEAYVEAGGTILRDLFQGDDGGWLQDVALVDRLVADKLRAEADTVAAEGWKWVEMAPDFAYGHTYGLRQLRGETIPLATEEEASRDALQAEYNRLSETYAEADELPDEVDARLGEIETAIEAFEARPITFDPAEVARAGAFVSVAHDGTARIERGYVRPEDELPAEAEIVVEDAGPGLVAAVARGTDEAVMADVPMPEPEEDEGLSALSDRLMTELTSHRTLGLRQALGERPDVAFLAALHALTLKSFYHYGSDSCLELNLKSIAFSAQAPELNDSASAAAIHARHEGWAKVLPKDSADLWQALQDWDSNSRSGLFAHVVSLSVNAVNEAWNRRPRALNHADQLARAVDLDMAAAGWTPTVDNFLGRVTKARILQAVSEAKGPRAAERIAHLKKGDMAREAEALLTETGWLPEPLRGAEPKAGEETAAQDGTTAMGEDENLEDTEDTTDVPPCRGGGVTLNTILNLGPPALSAGLCFEKLAMSGIAHNLSRRLADRAEAVCRHYLSNGRREGRYWLVGDIRNTPGRSLFVRLQASAKGPAGKWTDGATGEHGDLLDIIRGSLRLTDFADLAEEARRFLSLPNLEQEHTSPPRRVLPAPSGSVEAARRLFATSQPIAGTIAETYLRRRGITLLHETGNLRFHPRCYYKPDDGPTETWPAMIAAVTDLTGRITGVHRTWLTPDGSDKASVDTPRKAMGDLLGSAVRIGVLGDVVATGEGIETMLSLRQVLPSLAMAPALSAAHLAAILFPPALRRLYIVRDNDPAGDAARDVLIERANAGGIEAIPLSPALGDFNEDLQRLGMDALRMGVRVQLAPEDVVRFMSLAP